MAYKNRNAKKPPKQKTGCEDNGGYRDGSGRPPIKFSDEWWHLLEKYALAGCTKEEICGFTDIHQETLSRLIQERYQVDFSQWKERFSAGGKASLRRRLYHIAMSDGKDACKAAIHLSKHYLGMKDSSQVDFGDKPFMFAYNQDDNAE
jgi:hypothetical protein